MKALHAGAIVALVLVIVALLTPNGSSQGPTRVEVPVTPENNTRVVLKGSAVVESSTTGLCYEVMAFDLSGNNRLWRGTGVNEVDCKWK